MVPSCTIMKWCRARMVGRSALGPTSVISTVSGSTALMSVICLAIEFTLEPTAGRGGAEREDHVVGSEGLAVVERRRRLQLDGPDLGVGCSRRSRRAPSALRRSCRGKSGGCSRSSSGHSRWRSRPWPGRACRRSRREAGRLQVPAHHRGRSDAAEARPRIEPPTASETPPAMNISQKLAAGGAPADGFFDHGIVGAGPVGH